MNRGELNYIKESVASVSKSKIRLKGGSLIAEMVAGTDDFSGGKDKWSFQDGESLFLNFEMNPLRDARGELTLNIIGNVAERK